MLVLTGLGHRVTADWMVARAATSEEMLVGCVRATELEGAVKPGVEPTRCAVGSEWVGGRVRDC